MGNFRSGGRSGGFGGRNRGDGFRGRNNSRSFGGRPSGGFERRTEMHDATCDACGKQCQVPFKPSGDKPVLCNDCFRNTDRKGASAHDRPTQMGISLEQFNQLNAKLDKILAALENYATEDLDEDLDLQDEDSEKE
ncbi:hypothetical protein HYZ97_05105 [Candidatus Pacearchaeota archaeon]|nr:hypothetical protein [Candidatus Pacearchaeota archaeon]